MNDNYVYRIKRVIQGTFFILAASFLGWGFTPATEWFAGLILGTFFALLSVLFLAWKVHRVVQAALQYKGQKRRVTLGTSSRFSLAILAAIIALQFPDTFSLSGMMIGLLLPTMITYIDAIYMHTKMRKKEKGVKRCAY